MLKAKYVWDGFAYKKFVDYLSFLHFGKFYRSSCSQNYRPGIDSYTKGNFVCKILLIEFSLVALFLFYLYLRTKYYFRHMHRKFVARDLRAQLAAQNLSAKYAFIMRLTPSTLLTNLTSDVDAVKMFVAQAIGTLIASICLIIGASVLLLITNWQLGLAVLLIVPIIGGTFLW